jgi:hypothetical protein
MAMTGNDLEPEILRGCGAMKCRGVPCPGDGLCLANRALNSVFSNFFPMVVRVPFTLIKVYAAL